MQQRRFIFNGGNSTRFHTVDVHTRQDIGNHSFGVAWLCELITEGRASKNLIMAALAHDLAEHIVGDIPSPTKRDMGVGGAAFAALEERHLRDNGVGCYEQELTKEEFSLLKFADMLEGMVFCCRERKIGNQNVEIIFGRFRNYIMELLEKTQLTDATPLLLVLNDIVVEWKEVTNDQR